MSMSPLKSFSTAELDALRDATMRIGRDNDPIFSAPATMWWLVLAVLLVPPLQYAGLWLGLDSEGVPGMAFAFTIALALQLARPLEAVLVSAAGIHWVWTGLHLLSMAGWIAGDVGPLPRPS